MLCISAAYAVVRCLSVRLSGCLSRSFFSVETSKRVFRISSSSCSQIMHHSSFSIPSAIAIFRRGPRNRGVRCRWDMKKIAIFELYLALSHIVNGMRPSGVVNRVPPDRGKLVTLMAGSIKRRRLLIAGDGRRSATHQ